MIPFFGSVAISVLCQKFGVLRCSKPVEEDNQNNNQNEKSHSVAENKLTPSRRQYKRKPAPELFKSLSGNTENDDESHGHHFGNFHEYYSFHDCKHRCDALPSHFFLDIWNYLSNPEKVYILDIGSNEGDLTHELLSIAQRQLPHTVKVVAVGVELDDTLVKRAKAKYGENDNLVFEKLNIMKDCLSAVMNKHGIPQFSLVTCFSTTMWIHMNYGDDGLTRFLLMMGSLSDCSVLVEPQLWKSYRKAMERCRRRGITELPYYKNLKIKDIKKICINIYTHSFGMTLQKSSVTPHWNRPLLLFSFKPKES